MEGGLTHLVGARFKDLFRFAPPFIFLISGRNILQLAKSSEDFFCSLMFRSACQVKGFKDCRNLRRVVKRPELMERKRFCKFG